MSQTFCYACHITSPSSSLFAVAFAARGCNERNTSTKTDTEFETAKKEIEEANQAWWIQGLKNKDSTTLGELIQPTPRCGVIYM
jgi:hypothetical protein